MSLPLDSSNATQPVYRTTLSNGMVALVTENPTADIIAARLFIRAGSRWETAAQAGLSHLITAVLTKGTDRFSSLEIAEQVETVGASLNTDTSTDYFLLSLKTVSADFPQILKLAAALLRTPTFPETELELERRLTLQAIRSQQEQPFTLAFDQLRTMMYGNHPYALPGLGTEATVTTLTRTDLQQYHATHFRPDNLVVSLSGRITPDAAIALLQETFGDWAAPSQPLPTIEFPAVQSKPLCQAISQTTQQSILMVGYLTPGVSNPTVLPDYVALKLLNTHLGNGLSSRLFVELREKRGLAYEVSAFYTTRLDAAQFVAYMGTASDNTAIALEGLQSELDRVQAIELEPHELQAAKNKLLGQYALGKQTNTQLAHLYGWYETLGLGIEFDQQFQAQAAQTTSQDIQAVAQRYLTAPYVSLVGTEMSVMPLVSST